MKVKDLSQYTKHENCSDISDCEKGINEINKYLRDFDYSKQKPQKTIYLRLYKLNEKLQKLKTKK